MTPKIHEAILAYERAAWGFQQIAAVRALIDAAEDLEAELVEEVEAAEAAEADNLRAHERAELAGRTSSGAGGFR